MATTIKIDVVSAEESIFSGEATFIVAPAIMGEVGIYPRHTPMLTSIKPGALRITVADSDEEQLIFVSGGILEVQPGLVTALKSNASEVNYALAQTELAEAIAQLQAISKLRKKVH